MNECPTGAIKLVGMDRLPKAPKAAPAATPKAVAAAAAPKAVEGPATIALKASGTNPLMLLNAKKAVMESKADKSVEGTVVALKESGLKPLKFMR